MGPAVYFQPDLGSVLLFLTQYRTAGYSEVGVILGYEKAEDKCSGLGLV